MAKKMRITLAGKSIPKDSFTYRDLGFGRPVPQSHPWEAELEIEEFLTLLRPLYEETIHEYKKDDKITGEFEPLYPGAEQYPELEKFFHEEYASFADFFITSLTKEFVPLMFEFSKDRKYAINSLDTIQLVSDTIHLKGKAYTVKGATGGD